MRNRLALLSLLAGCTAAPVAPDAPVALDGGGADAGAADAPSPTDAPTDDDASPIDVGGGTTDAGPRPTGGLLSFSEGTFGGTTIHSTLGLFGTAEIDELRRGLYDTAACAIELEVGSCRRFTCPAATLVTDDAGELRIDVAGSRVVTLPPRTTTTGPYVDGASGDVLSEGDTVTFSVSGAIIPAFVADVVAPSMPVLTLPSTVSRTSNLVLAWTGTGGDTMQFSIVTATSAPGGAVTCLVDGDAGALTVDASLLAPFTAGATATLSASYFATTTVTAGAYTIDVSVAQGLAAMATVE